MSTFIVHVTPSVFPAQRTFGPFMSGEPIPFVTHHMSLDGGMCCVVSAHLPCSRRAVRPPQPAGFYARWPMEILGHPRLTQMSASPSQKACIPQASGAIHSGSDHLRYSHWRYFPVVLSPPCFVRVFEKEG